MKKDRRNCWGETEVGEVTCKGTAHKQSDFKAEFCNFKCGAAPGATVIYCAYTMFTENE